MAEVTSKRDDSLPSINTGLYHVQKVISVASGDANSGDSVDVLGIAPGQKVFLHRASIRTSASLGASATVQLLANGVAVTSATTAGAASKVDSDSDSDVPLALDGGELIALLVGGANITASATITVDLVFSARP
jgi:hypothetical protein